MQASVSVLDSVETARVDVLETVLLHIGVMFVLHLILYCA